ncbi:cytochrome c-type biogenesis protein CcdA [Desmospora sp. 8437]|uniref:Cytochrome C biogenesis protein CcdA n=1 Tax=Kroppenstedtia guangzhouensis TaxID=1274356 RepID=A0ABQ1FXB6_9BACL|nr:cytochrome c biogenesis protein CcdA [Kroppenstedtia guangzhouensis]EGK13065.1 cytochrome c-type biogenesis protein CcdA [Desmospora sp. 8437]GGA32417.1 cytochrome C biogenesis protein CcdA [Kroppenstedtia guangzhouensis]
MADVSIWLAFGAGVLSFISPCCLPLYPSYISYITGVSISQLQDANQPRQLKRATMFHTSFFILGFSIIFFALGFSASWVGSFFSEYRDLIRMLGGVLIAVMGLFMLGLIKPGFMMKEKRLEVGRKRWGYLGSSVIGMAFAAGWTPCVGPILVSVLALAASNPSAGLAYITAYTLGFAIPFFIMAFFLGRTRWILKYSNSLMKAGGALMVVFGVLLYTNQMTILIAWLTELFGGFTGF